MKLARWGHILFCSLGCGIVAGLAQQAQLLSIAPQTSVRVPARWKPSGVRYSNAQELVVTGQAKVAAAPGQPDVVDYSMARVLITTEQRTSHQDALKRLEDIAVSRTEPARYVEIGGWPAVELDFKERLPRRGQPGPTGDVSVPRSIVAVAAESRVVQFDISLAPGAPAALLEEAKQIARSSSFPRRGDPQEVKNPSRRLSRE
ncbi:MAG: hypothetical protein FJW37_13530 [Acidobacteria bacterium]|nr:hypothetical protein [Acidobacteriota bacterium]